MRGCRGHLSALMLMLAGMGSVSADSQRVGDWLLQDSSIWKDQRRFASADDLSKRGHPLVLLGCDKKKQSDKSSGSLDTFDGFKTIYFVNPLEDGFWSGQPSGIQPGYVPPAIQTIILYLSFTGQCHRAVPTFQCNRVGRSSKLRL